MYVHYFITGICWGAGMMIGSAIAYVVTCSIWAAIGVAAGTAVGFYYMYNYLGNENMNDINDKLNYRFPDMSQISEE